MIQSCWAGCLIFSDIFICGWWEGVSRLLAHYPQYSVTMSEITPTHVFTICIGFRCGGYPEFCVQWGMTDLWQWPIVMVVVGGGGGYNTHHTICHLYFTYIIYILYSIYNFCSIIHIIEPTHIVQVRQVIYNLYYILSIYNIDNTQFIQYTQYIYI